MADPSECAGSQASDPVASLGLEGEFGYARNGGRRTLFHRLPQTQRCDPGVGIVKGREDRGVSAAWYLQLQANRLRAHAAIAMRDPRGQRESIGHLPTALEQDQHVPLRIPGRILQTLGDGITQVQLRPSQQVEQLPSRGPHVGRHQRVQQHVVRIHRHVWTKRLEQLEVDRLPSREDAERLRLGEGGLYRGADRARMPWLCVEENLYGAQLARVDDPRKCLAHEWAEDAALQAHLYHAERLATEMHHRCRP